MLEDLDNVKHVGDVGSLHIPYRALANSAEPLAYLAPLGPKPISTILTISSLFFFTCWFLLPAPIYLNEVPAPRKAQFGGILGTQLFIFSGRGDHEAILYDLWRYDFVESHWRQFTPAQLNETLEVQGQTFADDRRGMHNKDIFDNIPDLVQPPVISPDANGESDTNTTTSADSLAAQATVLGERDPSRVLPEEEPAVQQSVARTMLAEQVGIGTSSIEDRKILQVGSDSDLSKLNEYAISLSAQDTEGNLSRDNMKRADALRSRRHADFPSGRFNGCHVATRDGLMMFGGYEKFYGLGEPDPNYMSRELWILNANATTPTWRRVGPLVWDFRGIMQEDTNLKGFEYYEDGIKKQAGIPAEQSYAYIRANPDVSLKYVSSAVGVAGEGIQITAEGGTDNTTEIGTGAETNSTKRPRKTKLKWQTDMGKITPLSPLYWQYMVERSAAGCSYDAKHKRFYVFGGRLAATNSLDNVLFEIDIKELRARVVTNFVDSVRPLPVKGSCAGSPQGFAKRAKPGEPNAPSGKSNNPPKTVPTLKDYIKMDNYIHLDDVATVDDIVLARKKSAKNEKDVNESGGETKKKTVETDKADVGGGTVVDAKKRVVNEAAKEVSKHLENDVVDAENATFPEAITDRSTNGEILNTTKMDPHWRSIMLLHGGRQGNHYSNQLLDLRKNAATGEFRWVPITGDYVVRGNAGEDTIVVSNGTSTGGIPPRRNHHACTYLPGYEEFWIFAGRSNHVGLDLGLLNDLWKYTVKTNTWASVGASTPPPPPADHAMSLLEMPATNAPPSAYPIDLGDDEDELLESGGKDELRLTPTSITIEARPEVTDTTNALVLLPEKNLHHSINLNYGDKEDENLADIAAGGNIGATGDASSTLVTASGITSTDAGSDSDSKLTPDKIFKSVIKPFLGYNSKLWPTQRFLPTLEYLELEDEMVIFGGQDNIGRMNDIWLVNRLSGDAKILQKCEYCAGEIAVGK